MTKSFSFSTVKDFDEHIRNSIPDYENLINTILKMSDFFITSNTYVYDIGTSTGSFLIELHDRVALQSLRFQNVHFVGIENESNFYRYHDPMDYPIEWVHDDVTKYQGWTDSSFITSIFTIQFIEPKKRKELLQNIYDSMTPGGGFIFAEKIYSNSSTSQEINTFLYYGWKRQFFSADEILNKERDLRTLMKLRTKKEVEQEISDIGWSQCDTFWQQHNFVAWMAIK